MNCGLNFVGCNGGFFIVFCKMGSFLCKFFEDVIDERVYDFYCFGGDIGIRMYLYEL